MQLSLIRGMFLLLCALTPALLLADGPDSTTPKEKFRETEKWASKTREAYSKAYQEAKTDDAKKRVSKDYSGEKSPDAACEKMLKLAREYPKDPIVLDVYLWLVSRHPSREESNRTAELVIANWITDEQMARVCRSLSHMHNFPAIDTVLRTAIEKSPHRSVQGYARYSLAMSLQSEADRRPVHSPKEREPYETEAVKLLQEVVDQYFDLKHTFSNLGDAANKELFIIRNLGIGSIAPELTGQDLADKTIKLSDTRGKVVLVAFWATWCGPCMGDVPKEQALVKRYEGKPFAIFGVNADKDREVAQKVGGKAGITWPSVWDGVDGPVVTKWNVQSWPTLYLIDAKGVIRYKGDYLRTTSVRENKDGKPEQYYFLDDAVEELMKEVDPRKP